MLVQEEQISRLLTSQLDAIQVRGLCKFSSCLCTRAIVVNNLFLDIACVIAAVVYLFGRSGFISVGVGALGTLFWEIVYGTARSTWRTWNKKSWL